MPLMLMNNNKSSKEIIMTIVLMLLISFIPKLANINWDRYNIFKKRECEYTMIANFVINNGVVETSGFSYYFGCVYKNIETYLIDNKKIFNKKKFMGHSFLSLPDGPIKINDNISVDIYEYTEHQNTKQGSVITLKYHIVIKSKYNHHIKEYIKDSIKIDCERSKTNILHVYKTLNVDKCQINYSRYEFQTTKSFDSLFFDKKDMLLNKLNDFKNNKDRYDRLGIPYTLGLLFHGSPGTGKTSCIKAIAKHMERNIFIINPTIVKTADDLIKIFMDRCVNTNESTYNIPIDKRIYVFEEIDASAWRKIIRSRKLEPEIIQDQDQIQEIYYEIDLNTNKKIMKKEKNQLTLGNLLEILDGIIEINGRIIIFTSNHPEIIDEALLRPGRIDTIIEFKNLTREDVKQMYKLWFSEIMSSSIYKHIKDYTYSQANLGKLFSLNDLEIINNHLINNTMCE